MGETLECPYCNKYIKICHTKKEHLEDYKEYKCPRCLKVFSEITVAYSVTRKIEEDN